MGWAACGPSMNINFFLFKHILLVKFALREKELIERAHLFEEKLGKNCSIVVRQKMWKNKNVKHATIFPIPLVLLLTDFYLDKLSCPVVPICI